MINLHVRVNIATIWLLGPRGHNATVDTIYDADYPGYTHTYTLYTHTHSKTQNHTHLNRKKMDEPHSFYYNHKLGTLYSLLFFNIILFCFISGEEVPYYYGCTHPIPGQIRICSSDSVPCQRASQLRIQVVSLDSDMKKLKY